ncbi:ABC transporter ATP-binding protein [Staphylococcus sp. 17KM0847]|uniref:ABC transporter ATP-binding protein n=1 Tax=Staphylococcus sp. 17KM0847 TaxID=2583989 RepID=UPI0015DC31C2|nr:ABC transporter ATP-binding protein [Staphylococcus sp. 17KM0847]QLK86549.1 ABC transporter ATP-binding protein [Staphylococcus sp. 17KM0847]
MLFLLDHVDKIKKGRMLLRDITWQVNEGERWLIYGLNGAGKSTLLNIINAYDFVTQGDVSLFGTSPGHQGYSAHNVRKQIGYISGSLRDRFAEGEIVQDVVLSGIYKSIGLYEKPTDHDMKCVEQVLEDLNMTHFKAHYFGQLSTGEQQRVLLARALVDHPKLLILDEPCNGLDYVGREQLLEMLSNIKQSYPQTAIIYVTHFMEEVTSEFTHALLLKAGRIQTLGQVEDVLTAPQLSQLLDMKVDLYRHKQRYQIVRQ